MDIIFMLSIGSTALTKTYKMINTIKAALLSSLSTNKGTYEPHSTSNCAIGIHPMPPI